MAVALTIRAIRLANARRKYDRKTAPFLNKVAAIHSMMAVHPISLQSRRWISKKILEMREDYLLPEHIDVLNQLDAANALATKKFETRMANRAAKKLAAKKPVGRPKRVVEQTPPPIAPLTPVEIWKRELDKQQEKKEEPPNADN